MAEDISLRRATREDADLLLAWRNDPEIVAAGASGKTVTREEHLRWLGARLDGSAGALFLILRGTAPVGQVRFDRREGDEAEVSIFLRKEARRQGAGAAALRLGVPHAFAELKARRIVARVLAANAGSQAFFRDAGFTELSADASERVYALAEVPHNRLTHGPEEEAAVAAVVRSGRWASGPRVRELEARTGAVAVASGSAALRLALRVLGVKAGDSVRVPAYSCVALPNAVLALGAKPVVADVDARHWNLDAAKPGPVAATIAVNTFGAPATPAGSPWIEDASHGFRAGLAPAAGAALAVMSLYATKLVGAGEGGLVFTRSAEHAGLLRDWRDYTDRAAGAQRHNDKMNELEAALALCQLERLPAMLAARKRLAARYTEKLAKLAGIELPHWTEERSWYRYAVRVPAGAAAMGARLRERGIRAERPVEDWREPGGPACPNADVAYAQLLSLPLYPTLTEAEQDRVVEALAHG